QPNVHRRVQLPGGGNERGGGINPNDVVPKGLQVSCQPAFTAADIQRASSWWRQQLKELRAMVPPVAVVSGPARPCDPLTGLGFPTFSEIHRAIPVSDEVARALPQTRWTLPEPHTPSSGLPQLARQPSTRTEGQHTGQPH